MASAPQFTISDILNFQQEVEKMGRNFYSCPKVHTTKAKRSRWFIRPSVPILEDGVWTPRQIGPVYLGFVKDISKREAEKARDEYCKTLNRTPVTIQSQIRFGDYLDNYEAVQLPTFAESSQQGYQSRIRHHIRPAFGDRRLCDLKPKDIQAWMNAISGTQNTKSVLLATLSSILETATDWGYLSGRNPCRRIRVKATEQARDLTVPSPAELAIFLEATSAPYTLPLELCLFCGLRIGEARGLVRRAIRPPELHVLFQRERYTNKLIPPKKGSTRRVPLPEWMAEKILGVLPAGENELLFPDIEYRAIWEHSHTRAKAVGIWRPGFGPHSLRRCYSTYRNQAGGESLQQAMGHRSEAMTRAYIRPTLARQLEEVNAMRSLIFGGVQ